MERTFNSPDYKLVKYELNPETGKYQKQPERISFNKMPFELKVETTREQRIINNGASEIITGRIKEGKREFFTGLVPTPSQKNWFIGNDYQFIKGNKKNSLVVFNFSEDNRTLLVYYFNSYYKDSRTERTNFVYSFIKSIQ